MQPQIWKFEPYQRIGPLIAFYFLAAPWPFEPTTTDYRDWLGTRPPGEREFYEELGFEACRAVNAFRQYWLEKRDYRLKDYLRMHLQPSDYAMYEQMATYGSVYPTCEERRFGLQLADSH
ncbi:hypothetical protein ACFPMF_07265 [Larkinella bovis]|uniref:Uncharacterized protein n=1 Tax=Larkinella bovis TaxID=683041 RepID=A0ABW0I9A4_9BACT